MDEYRNSKNRSTRLAHARRDETALSHTKMTRAERDQQMMADLTDLVLRRHQSKEAAALDLAACAGVSAEDMADHFIPEVARSLGDLWCSDQLGFAEVTIGVARLQAMLRDFGETWAADQGDNLDASTVLLVVLDNVYHTLGAFVLAGQLRRKGLSVRLLLGATLQNVSDALMMAQFDAVFISANVGANLESLNRTVKTIKTVCHGGPPVVIGGTLLETTADIIGLTGTDYIANTAEEAIALCNLRTKPPINAVMVQ